MKRLIVGCLLLAGCYHMRWARFVDGSEETSKAWICVPDDDKTNPKGVMCGDMVDVLKGSLEPVDEPAPADPGAATM